MHFYNKLNRFCFSDFFVSSPDNFHAARFGAIFLFTAIMAGFWEKFITTFWAFSFFKNKVDSSPMRIMKLPMFRVADYLEIFYSIICFISIYMMNMLIGVKFSPKILSHYISVFKSLRCAKHGVLRSVYKNVARTILSFSIFPIRVIRVIINNLNHAIFSSNFLSHNMKLDNVCCEVKN